MDKQLVFIQNDRIVTDSLAVAEVFKKDHDKVMRDIRNQLEKLNEAGEHEWGAAKVGGTPISTHLIMY